MFLKPKKAVIRRNRVIRGDIKGHGELNLHGNVTGAIEVDDLIIGRNGYVFGDVTAQTVRIQGYVKGNIQARQIIIEKGAHIEGELSYEQLSVAPRADVSAKLTPRPMLTICQSLPAVEDVLPTLHAA